MDEKNLQKLEELTLDLNIDLCILNSAISNDNSDLEICILVDFVEKIYIKSNKIRNIFANTI